MRKHIDYYYKCFDKESVNEIDRIVTEKFNDYGYNFDTNRRKTVNEENMKKVCYKNCLKLRKESEK
ncbi:MAG: hypothetical protein HFJ02_06650 [Bacilli bacterium]|nr:hypothetical protein [Bacilli bacterium]